MLIIAVWKWTMMSLKHSVKRDGKVNTISLQLMSQVQKKMENIVKI